MYTEDMGVDIQPVVEGKVVALDKVAALDMVAALDKVAALDMVAVLDKVAAVEDMQPYYQVHILQLDKQVHIHMMEEEPAAVAVKIPQQLM